MARVNVESYAFDDPRFDLLADALRSLRDRWHALGCCLRIWHQCASRRTDSVRPAELARLLCIRKPLTEAAQDLAVHAFVTIADLGERVGDRVRVRGTEGRTDYLERMDLARTLPERVLAHIEEHGPFKRNALRKYFDDTPRSTFYRTLRQLVADGDLEVTNDLLATPGTVPRESHGNPETLPGQSRDVVPAPDPAPVLVPVPEESANRARAHTHPHTPIPRDSRENPMGVPRDGPTRLASSPDAIDPAPGSIADLSCTERVPRKRRREVARALWRYQNELRARLEPAAPELPLNDVPGNSLDPVVLALANHSPAQCKHALDIFAIEAECLRDQGEDTLQYLNGDTNWKPKQLLRALGSTTDLVRKRFAKRTQHQRTRGSRQESIPQLKRLDHG